VGIESLADPLACSTTSQGYLLNGDNLSQPDRTSMAAPVVAGRWHGAQANRTHPNAVKAHLQYTAEARPGFRRSSGASFVNTRGPAAWPAAPPANRAGPGAASRPVIAWARHLIWATTASPAAAAAQQQRVGH
jgi:hypothetical protein